MTQLLESTYKVLKSDKTIKNEALLYANSLGLSENQYIKFFKKENSTEIENLIEELDYQKNIMLIASGLDNAIKNEIENSIY